MSYYNLDDKDLEILKMLSTDSRITYSLLAENIGITVPTVKSRVDKLLGLGIIDKFSLLLNYDLLSSHPQYFILVKSTPNLQTEIIQEFTKNKLILELHELISNDQVLLKTLPLDKDHLQTLLHYLREFKGVLEVNTLTIAQTHIQELSRIPEQIAVKIRCEYCSKPIERDYKTITIEGVAHYLCCNSCLKLYKQEILSST